MAQILIVDDSEVILQVLLEILQQANHTVCAASSGTQALQLLTTSQFDLIITDISMPAVDGLELMRRARQMRVQTPFIAISARPSPLNMFVPARGLGTHISLQKPFSPESLIEAVDAVLDTALNVVPAGNKPPLP